MSRLTRFWLLIAVSLLFSACSREPKTADRLATAEALYQKGQVEKARLEYLNVLQKEPKNLVATERVALIWLEEGAPMRALPYLVQVKAEVPGNLETRIKLAELLLALGKRAEARAEATDILTKSSRVPEALVLLTQTMASREDYDSTQKVLKEFVDRQSVSYQLAMANLLLARGDANGAKTVIQSALSADAHSVAAHLALGNLYAAQNDRERATEQFKLAAEQAPVRSAARMRYAEYLNATGAVAEATRYLQELTQQAPDFLSPWLALAQLALSEKKYDRALELLQNNFNRDPGNFASRLLRAQVFVAQGEAANASKEMEILAQEFPGLPSVRYNLAVAYLQNNEESKALALLKTSVAQNPDHDDSVLLMASLQLKAGDAASVVPEMVELLKKRPDRTQAAALLLDSLRALNRLDDAVRLLQEQLKKTPKVAHLHFMLGLVYSLQDKTAEARDELEQSLAIAPDQIQAVVELVNLELKKGNFSDAMARANDQVTKNPSSAASYFLVARVYAAEVKWREAERAAGQALERDPNFYAAYPILFEAFVAQGRQSEALDRMQAFADKAPLQLRAQALAGDVYLRLQDFPKARLAYEKCLSLKPDFPDALNNLAFLYSERFDQPEKALEFARKARLIEPRSPSVADTLGWILVKLKSYAEAHALLKDAAKNAPQNPEIQYHYAIASQKVGELTDARTAFMAALAAKQDFEGKSTIAEYLIGLDRTSAKGP